jgi:opacity protein-like surface antigen
MTMVKKNNIIFALLLLLFPRSALADVKISLKLQGGLSNLRAGDVNPGTQAFFDWGKIYFAPPPGGVIEGGYTAIHWGYEVGGDLVFELSPKVGIGIGAGYLECSKNQQGLPWMMQIIDTPGGDPTQITSFDASTKLSAIPLRLSLFLTLPLSGKLNFIASAGASYYIEARYHGIWEVEEGWSRGTMEYPYQKLSTTAEKKKTPLGFQGGIGIEYKVSTKTALFVEAQGRYAKFHGLEGTSLSEQGPWGGLFPPFSETGKLYYESVPMIPNEPRLLMVQSAPPNGPGGKPREAVVDFSGVSLQAGVRIYF